MMPGTFSKVDALADSDACKPECKEEKTPSANKGVPFFGNKVSTMSPTPANVTQELELKLLAQFLELSGTPVLTRESWNLCLNTIHFLNACEYSVEELCSVLALASKYFRDVRATCGARMTAEESSHLMVLLVYIAHCYALDETCALPVWHRCLSRNYCELPAMNAAILRLMRLRGYKLRLNDTEFRGRFLAMYKSATGTVL